MIPTSPRRTTAIRLALALFVLLGAAWPAWGGEPAGTVTHLSGPLLAKKADGSIRSLYIDSAVEEGDVLITEKRTYARFKMRDDTEITLRPNTQFKVDRFSFDKDRPQEDRSFFSLIKGGIRTVTGQIGKRGSQDDYRMSTPTAVTGVRGTGFGLTFCQQDCESLPDGLYIEVFEGSIIVYNKAGSQIYTIGQYGYVMGPDGKPTLLPGRPNLPPFSPPPSVPSLLPGQGGPPPGPPFCEMR